MDKHKITAFLITGQPSTQTNNVLKGVGKTTLLQKICNKLNDNYKLQGFFTEELRTNGQRIGFDVVTLTNARGILAREKPLDNTRRPKVGKYAVYVQDFEDLALPLLQIVPSDQKLLIVDEIGKMELISKRFEAAIKTLMQQQQPMLVSIPSQTRQPIPLVERLRNAPHATVYHVSKANRDSLVDIISNDICKTLFKVE